MRRSLDFQKAALLLGIHRFLNGLERAVARLITNASAGLLDAATGAAVNVLPDRLGFLGGQGFLELFPGEVLEPGLLPEIERHSFGVSPQAHGLGGSPFAKVWKTLGLKWPTGFSGFQPGPTILRLPGVHASRRSQTYKEPLHGLQKPALCVVAQGAKAVMLGSELYEYDASRMIVFAVNRLALFQVTRASRAEPFLCLKLVLDPRQITELTLKVYPHGLPPVREDRGVYLGQTEAGIVGAATRLLELMAEPRDAELLGPLVVEEILIRLLRSPLGSRVAQIGLAESGVNRIARAVNWVRQNFDQPIAIESLAEMVHMSPSSFHQHFKAVTSMSPLQFQKVLRLQEARRLMLASEADATTASQRVGYRAPRSSAACSAAPLQRTSPGCARAASRSPRCPDPSLGGL